MKNRYRTAALAAVIVLQLAALIAALPLNVLFLPGSRTLRLEAGLFDPLDLMRGRYVRLDFARERVLASELPSLAGMGAAELAELEGEELYCLFAEPGPDGFSTLSDAAAARPRGGRFYLAGFELLAANETDAGIELLFDFPFDRYYLQEDIASEAERILAEARDDSSAALLVRVAPNGEYLAEGLEIDGLALESRAKERRREERPNADSLKE